MRNMLVIIGLAHERGGDFSGENRCYNHLGNDSGESLCLDLQPVWAYTIIYTRD